MTALRRAPRPSRPLRARGLGSGKGKGLFKCARVGVREGAVQAVASARAGVGEVEGAVPRARVGVGEAAVQSVAGARARVGVPACRGRGPGRLGRSWAVGGHGWASPGRAGLLRPSGCGCSGLETPDHAPPGAAPPPRLGLARWRHSRTVLTSASGPLSPAAALGVGEPGGAGDWRVWAARAQAPPGAAGSGARAGADGGREPLDGGRPQRAGAGGRGADGRSPVPAAWDRRSTNVPSPRTRCARGPHTCCCGTFWGWNLLSVSGFPVKRDQRHKAACAFKKEEERSGFQGPRAPVSPPPTRSASLPAPGRQTRPPVHAPCSAPFALQCASRDDWRCARSMHEFSAKDIDGHMVNLDKYRGFVCIVTNVASQ